MKTTILITGATAGIGRSAALHLARRGMRVFATGRNERALQTLREEAAGTDLEAFRLDVTDSESIASAVARIDEATEGYGIDALVNNAGFGLVGAMADIPDADVRMQFDTNVFGLHAMTRAFLPQMLERRSGRIINVSSVGGRVTLPFFGVYNATKYAVESMSDALRREVAPFGVKVSLIEPGPIRSEFASTSMSHLQRYNRASSAYAPAYQLAGEVAERFESQSAGPEVIARAIERAVTARRPRARYVAPFTSQLMLALVAILPTRWTDAMLRRVMGLTQKNLLPPRGQEIAAAG